jgi:DNA polymerase-1
VSIGEARKQRLAFLDRYPRIKAAMCAATEDGRIRGFAPIIGGLRRHISQSGKADNQRINTPVQAGAGVVFRKAFVDLYWHFRGTNTMLVIPVHDSVLIECDLAELDHIRTDVPRIMVDAVRAYYPQLQTHVDVNDIDVTCWNKDGRSDSLDRFLEDPSFKI